MKRIVVSTLMYNLVLLTFPLESFPMRNAFPSSIAIQSRAILDGVVKDAFGAEVGNATVSLYSPDRVIQATSNEKGFFEFANVPPGMYQVEVVHQGFKPTKLTTLQVTDQNESLSLTLDIASTGSCSIRESISYEDMNSRKLTGTILDSTRGVPDAEVQLVNASGTLVQIAKRSNGKGTFFFDNLEPGQSSLRVSHPGYQTDRTENFWITRENTTKVDIRIIRVGLLRVCQ